MRHRRRLGWLDGMACWWNRVRWSMGSSCCIGMMHMMGVMWMRVVIGRRRWLLMARHEPSTGQPRTREEEGSKKSLKKQA